MLNINNLTVKFPLNGNNHSIFAVRNLNLHIKPAETFIIIGESGSGKSVLGMSILSLLPSYSVIQGEILYQNKNLLTIDKKTLRHIRGNSIGFVPQSAGLSLNPTMKIAKQLEDIFREKKGAKRQSAKNLSLELLNLFGLSKLVSKMYPHQLSGGMKQRVLVATGIAANPNFIIVDEPTKGLDYALKKEVEEIFLSIKQNKPEISILLITHDLELAHNLADRIGVMYSGQLIEVSRANEFFNQPKHPYSQGLLEASPLKSLTPIQGNTPSMDKILTECAFSARCSFSKENCLVKAPPLFHQKNYSVKCWQYGQVEEYDKINQCL